MKKVSGQMGLGEAHSKIILVGEHVVVHGKPAIAIPFPLKIKTKIIEKSGEITVESNLYTGLLSKISDHLKGIEILIYETLAYLQHQPEGLHITIDSEIPIGQGLGSSAATAVSLVRALFDYYKCPIEIQEIYSLVNRAETFAHGKSSGIDMMTVMSAGPIYFTKDRTAVVLDEVQSFFFVVGDTGNLGNTKKAVESVKRLLLEYPVVMENTMNQIEQIVIKSKEAIRNGDMKKLGMLLTLNHRYLKELEVSDDLLDQLVEEAIATGALGAKLTGGGLGGCMIALASNKEDAIKIGNRLLQSGAKKAWYFATDGEHAYEIDGKEYVL